VSRFRSFIEPAMQAPALPESETARIATLRDLLILDTEPEARFDLITAYAASQFGVSIVLVSLVDAERQWFKSCVGLEAAQTPRDISFCGHAILHPGIFEVPDAREDPRFADNPLVTGNPWIRFYAGCPLLMANGEAVGTLCLIDRMPKRLDAWERDHLQVLGKMVAAELQGVSSGKVEGRPHIPAFYA
jgi:GAF domain-containing protein